MGHEDDFHLRSSLLRNLGGAAVTHAIPGLGEARFAARFGVWTAQLASRTAVEAGIESYIHDSNYLTNATWIGGGTLVGMGVVGIGSSLFRGLGREVGRGMRNLPKQSAIDDWKNLFPGIQVKRIADYWVKRVNPNSHRFLQWWGRQTIRAQQKGLKRLGDMGTPHFTRNGMLFTKHVGDTFAGGRFSFNMFRPTVIKNYIKGSWRMKNPFNDIIPRNMGRSALIFDPAIDWFTASLTATAGLGITWGGYLLFDELLE